MAGGNSLGWYQRRDLWDGEIRRDGVRLNISPSETSRNLGTIALTCFCTHISQGPNVQPDPFGFPPFGFPLGMAGGGRADGLERFFKTEDAAASSWEAIARAYAIGRCTEEEMRTGLWRHKVQEILDKALFKRPNGRLNVLEDAFGEGWYQRRDLWDAFLAGAYARFGKDGTFLLHNGAVAYYVSDLLGPWGYDLSIEVNPGFPGVAKVTLKMGEVSDKPIQTFVDRMGSLRAALSKGPNPIVAPIRPSVTPRACAPVAPPSGAADR